MLKPLTPEQNAWRWRIIIATYLGYAGYYLTRKVFGIAKTTIADDLGWDLGSTAHIWTAFLFAYMLGQFINSWIGRKYGPRVLLLGGLGLSIVFNIIFGFANSFETFLIFMFFNGLVQASGWPGVVGGISRWLRPEERGRIIGIWATSYMVGNILVKSLGGLLLANYGWDYAFFGCTLGSFAIWWLIYFWQRDKPEDVGLEPIVDDSEREYQAVEKAQDEHVPFREYLRLAFNPVVLTMGTSYFCIKFMRYALDSWLPAFLNLQGLDVGRASYYSQIFDFAGLAGAICAGWALDKVFRGNWAALSFVLGIGMMCGYLAVIFLGTSPWMIALCFGIVGFMLYGPDMLLSGAAAVEVAGARNGVAVAGIVNGIGSIGPVVQEQVIGWLVSDNEETSMMNTNYLALSMSALFTFFMLIMIWRLNKAHKELGHHDTAE
jgi:sugar phosphate permease